MNLTFDEVAQYDHVVTGALIIVYFAFLGHPILGLVLALTFAGLKEFVYDRYYEDATTRGSDWEDFVWYLVGIVFGEILVHAPRVFGIIKRFA